MSEQNDKIKVRLPWQFLAEIEATIEDHYEITDGDDDTMAWADLCRLIVDDGVRATKAGDVDVMVTVEQIELLMVEAESQAEICDPKSGGDRPARGRMLARFAGRLAVLIGIDPHDRAAQRAEAWARALDAITDA
jgi:hypothetical protein